MNKITLVTTPDGNYELIYINGSLYDSQDAFYSFQWVQIINKNLPFGGIDHWELSFAACDKFEYKFPKLLSDYEKSDYRIRS